MGGKSLIELARRYCSYICIGNTGMHSCSTAVQERREAVQERRRAVQENVLENSRTGNSLKAVQAV